MPLVMVSSGFAVTGRAIWSLTDNLPGIVAAALSCDDSKGKITSANVEVWSRARNRLDIGLSDLQIIILTEDCPEKRANLDERQKMITDAVKELLPPNIHGYVWVTLVPGSFGQF